MSHPIIRFLDRAKETTTTTGSGTISLGGAVAGFVGISGVGNGNSTYYTLQEGNNFEIGIGTYATMGNTLSRDEVFSSSNSDDSKIDLAGSTTVFITYPADKAVTQTSGNYVGIGIDPEYQLQVSGTGSFNTVRWADGTTQTTADTDTTYTAGTGLTLVGTEFNTSGTGHFDYLGIGTGALTPTYALDVAGDAGFNEYIYHNGDGNTFIRFAPDLINLVAGSWSAIKLEKSTGKIQLNNTNRDLDVQLMAEDGGVILHTDAATNQVGIGTAEPSYTLEVSGTGSFNTVRWADGTTQITSATGDISTVSGLTVTNATNIASTGATNSARITTNTTNIASTGATNGALIATNTTNIATNVTNIASTGSSNLSLIRSYIDTSDNATFNNLTAQGNLTVSGTLTYLDSTTVTIADKQLELASNSGTPIGNDSAVNDGGIVVKSTDGDKKWTWLDATDAWTSTENISLNSSKKIIFGDSTEQTTSPTGDISTVSGLTVTNATNIASTGATNAAAAATNATNISTNATNISTNTTNIASTGATNAAAILANTSNISTNTTNIASTGATNAAAILANTSNISTNTTNIASTGATNAAAILANTSNISTNTTNIASTGATNAAAILANTSNISTNTTNIASTGATNAAAILANTSNISTNTTNIASTGATNAAAILANTSNISTNTTNIASTGATNAASIATVSGLLPSPGGSDTQIQFNDGGSFGGDSGLIWHKTHNLLTVNGTGVFDRIGVGTDSPTYELDVAGDIGVDEYLYHNGDGDTYLRLRDNNINLVAGGKSAIDLNYSTGKIQLNNSNADLDVQIMADDGGVIFHTDAGKNQVGIGTDSPDAMVDILCGNDTDRGLKIEMTASGSVNPFEIVHSDGSPRFGIDTAGDINCGAISGSGANFTYGRADISPTIRTAAGANNLNIRNVNADKDINIDVHATAGAINFRDSEDQNTDYLHFKMGSYSAGTGMHIRSRDDTSILTQWQSSGGTPVAMVNPTGAISGQHFIFGDGTTQSTASAGGGGGAPTDAQYVTLALDGDLSAERVLAANTGIHIVDGGANGNVTISVSGSTTSQLGIVQLQDSATDGTTDKAITPNAVYDISGVLSTSIASTGATNAASIVTNTSNISTNTTNIAATGATNAAAIAAKDNYQYWTITDGSNTSNLQTTEDVKITGAGQVTVTLASGNPNVVTVSGAAAGGGGGSPGGSDTQVQFNDSTSFGGDSDLTWNKTTNVLTVAGHIAATTKSFLIDHPVKENKRLQYASLEGPENGVYVRGHTTSHVIELPYYWVALVDPESITVHLTAKGKPQPSLCVNRVSANKVYLSSDQHISAYYTVSATRKDVPPLEVEI